MDIPLEQIAKNPIQSYQDIPKKYSPRLLYSLTFPVLSGLSGLINGYVSERARMDGIDADLFEKTTSAATPLAFFLIERQLRKRQDPVIKLAAPGINSILNIATFQVGSGIGKMLAYSV